ncbi:hypothetical protein, partial [Faecalibaculum rodentium]
HTLTEVQPLFCTFLHFISSYRQLVQMPLSRIPIASPFLPLPAIIGTPLVFLLPPVSSPGSTIVFPTL